MYKGYDHKINVMGLSRARDEDHKIEVIHSLNVDHAAYGSLRWTLTRPILMQVRVFYPRPILLKAKLDRLCEQVRSIFSMHAI